MKVIPRQGNTEKIHEAYEINETNGSVEIWLNQRLPNVGHSNGRHCPARDDLRKALRRLAHQPGMLLSASYSASSADRSGCDVENVLFYNVGAGAFESITRNGLRFERLRRPPELAPSGLPFTHYHRYGFIETPERPITKAATLFEFALDGISSSTKPHTVWWAASGVTVLSSAPIKGRFELHVELAHPKIGNPSSILKPLVDGIISAMHSESNIDLEAVQRLCAATGWRSDEVQARLRNPGCPVLGPRHLLGSYRDFVKWNPADDLCEACTLLIRTDRTSTFTVLASAI
jgi:hypothetical protein